jgi:hypothetical protein
LFSYFGSVGEGAGLLMNVLKVYGIPHNWEKQVNRLRYFIDVNNVSVKFDKSRILRKKGFLLQFTNSA